MKTVDEWLTDILACSYHFNEHDEDEAIKSTIQAVRTEAFDAAIEGIEKKYGPYASEIESRWNDALRTAIVAIEELKGEQYFEWTCQQCGAKLPSTEKRCPCWDI